MQRALSLFALLCLFNIINARIVRVPEHVYPRTIQQGIIDANPGDTVSVWGEGEPPFTYEECITIDKYILVVNRSFLPGHVPPEYDSSWNYVIIDGQFSGSVVTFAEGLDRSAILKGFTIKSGLADCGGGIYIYNSSPSIIANLIEKNEANAGGGIYAITRLRKNMIVTRCSFEDNKAYLYGGGIYITSNVSYDSLFRNVFTTNQAVERGGGIYISYASGELRLIENTIYDNIAQEGGGVYSKSSYTALRNSITKNNYEGVHCLFGSVGPDPYWGCMSTVGPGYNQLYDNIGYDLTAEFELDPDDPNKTGVDVPFFAQGNYWGSLDSDTIRSHIHTIPNVPPYRVIVYFDPIAASDRVSSVTYDSYCETDAIITGDLTVNQEVNLTIAPGKTFKFLTIGDDTDTGNYPNLCELLVEGELWADGSETEKISFIPFPPSPLTGGWYGIILKPYSTGYFDNCIVGNAYCGIEAEELSNITVDYSTIEWCQVFGIRLNGVQSAEIARSEINHNIYGIRCENIPMGIIPVIKGNTLIENESYGIMVLHTEGAVVRHNHIIGGSPPNLRATEHGILLAWGGHGTGLYVKHNKVEWCAQSGIYDYGSNAQLHNDTLLNNYMYGLLYSGGSTSSAHWCYVDLTKVDVYCEDNSFPTLGLYEQPIPNPGMNQFLMQSTLWVENRNESPIPISAHVNWWGINRPDMYPERFVGPVDFRYWLTEPPPPPPPEDSTEEGGGGQSDNANILKPTLTFALNNPKPNPTKGEVRISYSIPSRCISELIIWDISGRIVTKIIEEKDAGNYEFLWKGKNQRERTVPNGIYLVRLKAGNNSQTQKITIAR